MAQTLHSQGPWAQGPNQGTRAHEPRAARDAGTQASDRFSPRQQALLLDGVTSMISQAMEQYHAQIEALHAKYVDEIRALFDRHKGKMGAEWVKARGEKLYLEDEGPSSSSKKVD